MTSSEMETAITIIS